MHLKKNIKWHCQYAALWLPSLIHNTNSLVFMIFMAVNLLYISLTIVSKEQNGLSKSLDIFLPLNNLYDRDLKYSIFKWKSEWIELKLLWIIATQPLSIWSSNFQDIFRIILRCVSTTYSNAKFWDFYLLFLVHPWSIYIWKLPKLRNSASNIFNIFICVCACVLV